MAKIFVILLLLIGISTEGMLMFASTTFAFLRSVELKLLFRTVSFSTQMNFVHPVSVMRCVIRVRYSFVLSVPSIAFCLRFWLPIVRKYILIVP